jgi:hypothetical protein
VDSIAPRLHHSALPHLHRMKTGSSLPRRTLRGMDCHCHFTAAYTRAIHLQRAARLWAQYR